MADFELNLGRDKPANDAEDRVLLGDAIVIKGDESADEGVGDIAGDVGADDDEEKNDFKEDEAGGEARGS